MCLKSIENALNHSDSKKQKIISKIRLIYFLETDVIGFTATQESTATLSALYLIPNPFHKDIDAASTSPTRGLDLPGASCCHGDEANKRSRSLKLTRQDVGSARPCRFENPHG